MDRWTGKVALVTGASVGIGPEIATVLAKNGMKVIIAARRATKLQELTIKLKQEYNLNVYPIRCDLREEEQILRMFKWAFLKLGGVDVLVNNAAIISKELISGKFCFLLLFIYSSFSYTLSLKYKYKNLIFSSHKDKFYKVSRCIILYYIICDRFMRHLVRM